MSLIDLPKDKYYNIHFQFFSNKLSLYNQRAVKTKPAEILHYSFSILISKNYHYIFREHSKRFVDRQSPDVICFVDLKQNSKLYRWFVLSSAFLTMFLRSLFIFGTIPVLSNYYNTRFIDRKLSSMIGSIQISVGYIAGE